MKKHELLSLFAISFIFFVSCNQQVSTDSGWKAVYKHDEQGNPLSGSLDSLISGIRNGYDVRVGWGWERALGDSIVRLEHMAEPLFLSIIQEQNVSVVIDPHPLLSSYLNLQEQTMRDEYAIWQCVLTTKGEFNAKIFDGATGELIRDFPQTHRMTWFLDYPEKHAKSVPLFQ